MLERHGDDIARLVGYGRPLVEFGAGAAIKARILLAAMQARTFVPIDISGAFLEDSAQDLARAHPNVRVLPVAGDFTRAIALPALDGPLVGFFPGSTIGNFDHSAAIALLRSFRRTLGAGARLVIGIDTRKNPHLLEAAYDDAAGVTAQFNLNLLHRINRELDGTIPVDRFEHRAIWHDALGRIEMHLVASDDLEFHAVGQRFRMRANETIHTENSYKYTQPEARLLARAAGWEPAAFWTDKDQLFGLHVWVASEEEAQP